MNEELLTPEGYPAECTISDTELRELADALTDEDNEDWRSYVEEWPPTDDNGNVYPIWFTLDETNDRGEIYDEDGNHFNPFTGNMEPKVRERADYCNAPLNKWRKRYPNIRYCSVALNKEMGYEVYCHFHKGRGNFKNMKSAEEHLQTGLWTKTVDHLYEQIGPWKKLVGWGTFESLMGESTYEFGPEPQERTFDFSDEDMAPHGVDADETLEVKCHYPTDHVQPAMALYVAAMQQVQMMSVQPHIMYENREEGQGMMETRSVEKAQLTSPTDSDPTQRFKTIETWNEHHLNLPLSRLIKDQPRLLEMGGVTVDPESNDDTVGSDDIVLEVEANAEGLNTTDDTGTDPNAYGGNDATSESERILESASGGSDTDESDAATEKDTNQE